MAKNKKPQTNSGNKARTKYEIKMDSEKLINLNKKNLKIKLRVKIRMTN